LTPDRRTLLALFSLAFGLRILYAVLFGSDPDVVSRDSYAFRTASRMVQDWDWVTTPFSPSAPGYRMLLAAAFKLFGVSWWTAVILNAVLGASTTLFLYRIGERLLGKRVGLVSALWLGLSVSHMHYASFMMRDVLVTFLLTWLAYTLARPFYRMRTAVWTAFLCALLFHTEPMFMVLLPLLVIFLALASTHHRALSTQYVFLFAAALVVFFIPWTVRNFVVYRDVVPVSLESTRYTAPVTRLLQDTPPGPESVSTPPLSGAIERPGFVANEREFWRAVRLTDSPGDPARGVRPEPAWSLRHNLINMLNYGVLLPFFLAGLILAWKIRQRAALVLGSIVLSYALLRGFIWEYGARLLVEPLIILVAFYGVRVLLDMRRAAGEPEAPA
jgi:4-amino-4-deoxy-L-arabinose transferase-like glycosyltransferase